jgi:hypothetical protein
MRKVLRLEINAEHQKKKMGPLRSRVLDAEVGKRMRALSSTQKHKVVQRAITMGVLAQESEAHQAAASRYATSKTLLQVSRPKTSAQSRFQSTWFMCTYHHDDWVCAGTDVAFPERSASIDEVTAWAKRHAPFRKLWAQLCSLRVLMLQTPALAHISMCLEVCPQTWDNDHACRVHLHATMSLKR